MGGPSSQAAASWGVSPIDVYVPLKQEGLQRAKFGQRSTSSSRAGFSPPWPSCKVPASGTAIPSYVTHSLHS